MRPTTVVQTAPQFLNTRSLLDEAFAIFVSPFALNDRSVSKKICSAWHVPRKKIIDVAEIGRSTYDSEKYAKFFEGYM
jgi:hypothetical protein